MLIPDATLRAIEISLRGLPDDISPAERHRLEALAAVNYCGALGRMLSAVSVEGGAPPQRGK